MIMTMLMIMMMVATCNRLHQGLFGHRLRSNCCWSRPGYHCHCHHCYHRHCHHCYRHQNHYIIVIIVVIIISMLFIITIRIKPSSGHLGGVWCSPPGFHSKGRVSHPGRASKDSEIKGFLVGFTDWQFGTVVPGLCINNSYCWRVEVTFRINYIV